MRAACNILTAFLLFLSMFSLAGANDSEGFAKIVKSLRPRYTVGDVMPRYRLAERMKYYGVPGVAVGIIKNGKLAYVKGFGILQEGGGEPVNGDTLFSAGSVSKIATAALILKMHADGEIDIDSDISQYLKSWNMPVFGGEMPDPITLRMILSHTAGLSLHGFRDVQPGEDMPSVYDTLNGVGDEAGLEILFQPGTRYKYSGGGYTLAQLIVSDTQGVTFPDAAKQWLFSATGMVRSSFANPLPQDTGNIAKAHNHKGEPTALPRGYEAMPEMAASGLWTSANDLGELVAALIQSYRSEDGFLPQNLATDMMTKVAPSEHGLAPRMEGIGQNRFFHHAGSNDSYRTWIEGHLGTGDGLVVLTNGARGNELFIEIRNAVADSLSWGINKPVYLPEIPFDEAVMIGFEGWFKVDTAFPVEEREQLIGWIYDEDIKITAKDGELLISFGNSERKHALIATAPNRFLIPILNPRVGIAELVFHRNSIKKVDTVTLEMDGARSFYRRKDNP